MSDVHRGPYSRTVLELRDGWSMATDWVESPDDQTTKVHLFLLGALSALPDADPQSPPIRVSEVVRTVIEFSLDGTGTALPQITLRPALPAATPAGRFLLTAASRTINGTPGLTAERIDQVIDHPLTSREIEDVGTIYADADFEVTTGGRGAECVLAVSPREALRTPQEALAPPEVPQADQDAPDAPADATAPPGGVNEDLAQEPDDCDEKPPLPSPARMPKKATELSAVPPLFKREGENLPSTPGGRTLLRPAARYAASAFGDDLGRVDEIIDHPVHVFPGWNGATTYSDGKYDVVVGARRENEPADCVLMVGAVHDGGDGEGSTVRRAAKQAGSRKPRGKSDPRRPLPQTVPEFLDRVREYGFEIDDQRRHYAISHPSRPGVVGTIPRTPSDRKWSLAQVTSIRQTFDIDVRMPLS